RLENGVGNALCFRRLHIHVEALMDVFRVGPEAQETHLIAQTQCARSLLQRPPARAFACDDQHCRTAQPGNSVEQDVEPLDALESSDGPDNGCLVIDPELTTNRAADA